jgi:cellobiose phosphorylase
MNHTVLYQGGKKTHFNRAETAANFGREIGLQYVHAHIRYMEAMYEIHAYDRAFEAFMMIHPIHLHNHLKHALPRQRNSYFSSSDADFKTRYEAMDRFNDIKSGSVHVKGGWRIYSSGPGILIHQMITQTYGITRYHKQVFIRPKLPEALKALQVYIKKGD